MACLLHRSYNKNNCLMEFPEYIVLLQLKHSVSILELARPHTSHIFFHFLMLNSKLLPCCHYNYESINENIMILQISVKHSVSYCELCARASSISLFV